MTFEEACDTCGCPVLTESPTQMREELAEHVRRLAQASLDSVDPPAYIHTLEAIIDLCAAAICER